MRRAVVDIGITACRLVVVEASGGGPPRTCVEREIVLSLGRAARRDGRLGEGLLQLTEETLRRLHDRAMRADTEELRATLAVGLYAAEDGHELHARAEAVLGTDVEVVADLDDPVTAADLGRRRDGPGAHRRSDGPRPHPLGAGGPSLQRG